MRVCRSSRCVLRCLAFLFGQSWLVLGLSVHFLSCSHGPLNNFSFSTVRIISLLDVISINSVVGQVACISLKVCVLLFFSSCLAFAALVLYLLIASRADFMSIGIRPLGVFFFRRASVAEPIMGGK